MGLKGKCLRVRASEPLTAYAQAVGRDGCLDLLSDGVVGGALVRPLVLPCGVGYLQVP